MLDENRRFLPSETVERHVRDLNASNFHSLATEWEVLVLNLVSKMGKLRHELPFRHGKRPDIYLRSRRIRPFIADIVAVSDRHLHKENPSDFFYECVRDYLRKRSLLGGGLNIEFTGKRTGEYRDQKVKLHLPPKDEIPAFVKRHFAPIVQAVKSDPHSRFITQIIEGQVEVKVSYGPGTMDVIVGGPDYRVPYSRQRNPIFNALKSKAEQLKQCDFHGPAGVFLCDADCYALHARSRGAGEFTLVDIIEDAFRLHSTLSFIVVLTVEEKQSVLPLQVERRIKGACYLSAVARRGVDDVFRNELGTICRLFPVPCDTPANALRVMKSKRHQGYSFMGGYRMSNGEISISSRTLADILAGNLDYSAATKDINGPFRNLARVKDILRAQLRAGRMISEVSVVHCPDEDDDWIKIEFGPSDGAISKFR